MLILPFIPSPNPDEILGSWLARVKLHNGQGAWRSLLEASGYRYKIEHPLFDLIPYSVKFEALLAALGTSYEQAMIELTTLPYWLTFDAVNSADSQLPGLTVALGFLSGTGRVWSSMSNMGIARTSGNALRPRYCPKCLEKDISDWGEAYWHRAHQIPNALFCHRHECALRSACPYCGITVAPAAKRLIDLPKLRCRCGGILCVTPVIETSRAHYLKLAKLSAQALSLGPPRWDGNQVRSHLLAVLQSKSSRAVGQYKSAITAAFGEWRSSSCARGEENIERDFQHPEFKVRLDFSISSAPECCAVMAALDLDFSDVIPEFVKASPDWLKVSQERVPSNFWNIQRAKEALLRKVVEYPHHPISKHRRPYWLLRLSEPKWLYETFPSALADPIPTVETDREDIQRRIADTTVGFARRRVLINNSPAGLRAYFRDRVWFHNCLMALRDQYKRSADDLRGEIAQVRATALKAAFEEMLNSEQRPKRICASVLGTIVGLSQAQTGHLIQKFPELGAAIVTANADKPRRQVLWAARQLQALGQALSLKAVLKRASMPTRAENFVLARAAVAKIQSEKER